MKILVTGSSGTIGTRLCETLVREGHEVTGVDWRDNKWNEQINTLTYKVDLRDREALSNQLPNDFDIVIHLAANARVYNLVVDPKLARDNFETLFNVLEFARQNDIERFIFASSREVYGNTDKAVHDELEAHFDNCESPYTASKIGGESLVRSYQQCYGTQFIILRFSNVYGMYDDSDRIIPLFIQKSLEEKTLTIYGEQKLLDFTYIDDAVSGIMNGINHFGQCYNETYNLAYGEGVSLVELAHELRELLGTRNEIIIEKNRPGEVMQYIADITKAQKKLGYKPNISVHDGLQRSIEWYKHLFQYQ